MITAKTFPKANRVTANMPEHLKDPANYQKIMKALLETLSCGKGHSDPLKMMECAKCTENMRTRKELMDRLGFKSPAQFMAWRKIMETMISRQEGTLKKAPLKKYNDPTG